MSLQNARLLVVDDDTELAQMLKEYLEPEGIELTIASTGNHGLSLARAEEFKLIVLDVMLPGLSGFDVLREYRSSGGTTPVIMLTARGDDIDRIVGLEMGADDYLPKPFNPRELLARIKAILRRSSDAQKPRPTTVQLGLLRADMQRRELSYSDTSIPVTNAEFIILTSLMQEPGEIVSRAALTKAALGRQLLPDDRSLDTHVSNLRRKLAKCDSEAPIIRSIRGNGYMLVSAATDNA